MSEISLKGYTPSPRYDPDDALWNRARIEEAPEADGPWAIIEAAFTLAPPVADPARPPTYNFTTTGATLEAGWYRVVWIDEDDEEQPSEPVERRPVSEWAPTIADVADLVRVRTRDDVGVEFGTFTMDTRPTSESVQRMIAAETGMVLIRTGSLDDLSCPTAGDVRAAARQVIAKRVAAIIEASYRPDEVAEGRTVADFYEGMMDDDVAALVEASRECAAYVPGGPGVEAGGRSARPEWYFPPAAPLEW